jgi:flagellar FliL protein
MADKQDIKIEGEKTSSSKKLFVIIGAILIGIIAGGVVAFFLLKSDKPADVQPENVQMQVGPGMVSPTAPTIHYIKFEEPFMVQLHIKPRERLVQIYVALTTKSLEEQDLANTHKPLIKAIISSTLNSADVKLFNNQEGRERLKALCLKAIQDQLFNETGKSVIEQVLFTGFVMQ